MTGFPNHNAMPSLVMKQSIKKGFITKICGHNWNVLKIEPPFIRDGGILIALWMLRTRPFQWVEALP